MSFITITLTRTISQVGTARPTTSPDVPDVTTHVLTGTSSRSMRASDVVPSSESVISLPSDSPSNLAPISVSTGQLELDLSATASRTSSKSLMPPTSSPSSDSDDAQGPSIVPNVRAPEKGLSRGQITAIIASVVSVTVLIIAISIAVRCFVVRRRLYNIEELPKRKLEISPDGAESQTEQGYKGEARTSVAGSSRSSIWGDLNHPVVPTSLNDDVWDSRHWPLPPGHSERYTFFSERSSISIDEAVGVEQWGGGPNESRDIGDRIQVVTQRESGTGSRCDSIWGISEAGVAH